MEDIRSRRALLRASLVLAPVALAPIAALARSEVRTLAFSHTHTGEKLDIVYARDGAYLPEALRQINYLLRDFRSGDVHSIDPQLLDVLARVRDQVGSRGTFEVISGFRSPATNDMLRQHSSGVARNSMHLKGQAIDVRLAGADTRQVRRAALSLRRGGVGYYPDSDFVHLDTGPVRTW